MTALRSLGLAGFVCVASLGCEGTFGVPQSPGAPRAPASPGDAVTAAPPEPAVPLPAAVACNGVSVGRSYRGFAGEALDASRLPLAAGQDMARIRDGSDLQNFFEERSIRGASVTRSDQQSFGIFPERWLENRQASFATLYRAYALAFDGCLDAFENPQPYSAFTSADFQVAPTPESAQRQCQVLGKKLWLREMIAEELQPCVEYAQEVQSLETVPHRQWAYICASIAGAASFLTY